MATLEQQLVEAGAAWRTSQPEIAMPDFRQRRASRSPSALALTGLLGAIAVGVAIVSLGLQTPFPPGVGASPSPTTPSSPQPFATQRLFGGGDATWSVACNGTPDADCDEVVALFINNLGRSWRLILDKSGGQLAIDARPCPTWANGLTAARCWDVSALIPDESFCMVVAHGANDPRYAAFFQIGGRDGSGEFGGHPAGWPMCLAAPISSAPPPSLTETTSPLQLPAPGGTCLASQFVLGEVTSYYEYSTAFTRAVNASQSMTNVGDDCILAVPKVIAIAASNGQFVPISLPNAGHQDCVGAVCKTVYPGSYEIPSGQSVRIDLRAWWPWDPGSATSPAPLCEEPITDVTRAVVPFASGDIEFSWSIAFHEVCASAGRIGISVGTN